MARTLNELFEALKKKAPLFVADDPIGRLVLEALAWGMRAADLALDAMTGRLDRLTATGSDLDAILTNLGLRPRDAWEDDEDVAARAYVSGRGPTPGHLVDEMTAALAREAVELTYAEPRLLCWDLDFYWDIAGVVVGPLTVEGGSLHLVSVSCPLLEAVTSPAGEYLDVDFYQDLSFLAHLDADLERDPYRRLARTLDALTPAGVAHRLEIVDTPEDPHVALIWRTTSGFIL